uniref:Uncharacterized protein n=1 Tax=Fagus sylvatica TaxID=28930 RepID=A0A2N9G3X4_FAGSY
MEGKKNQSLPVVVMGQDRYVSKRSEIPRSNDISNKHEMSGGDQSVHHGEVVSFNRGHAPPSAPSSCTNIDGIGNHEDEMIDGKCPVVGRVLQVIDPDETGGGGNWLRVKVMVDVEEPYVEAAKLALMVTLRFGPPSSMNVFLTIVTGVVALVTLKLLSRVKNHRPIMQHQKIQSLLGPDHVPDQPRVVEANLVPNHEASPPPNQAPSQTTRSELFEIQLAEIDKEIGFNANQTTTLRQEKRSHLDTIPETTIALSAETAMQLRHAQ